jgi:hypothetical protein
MACGRQCRAAIGLAMYLNVRFRNRVIACCNRIVQGKEAFVAHQLRKALCILGREQCNTNVQRQPVCVFG